MKFKQDIEPKNDKGEWHGYQEWYTYINTILTLRGMYKNDIDLGYQERHWVEATIFVIR
jgi:hypothetical protein